MADGQLVSLRAVVLEGAGAGPVLYMGAAVHGDEICGIEVMRQLVRSLKGKSLHGALLLLPVQNPLAFYNRQRFLPAHAFDVFTPDVARSFPGSQAGEVSEVIAHAIMERFVIHSDVVIDVHTALAGGLQLDYAYTSGGRSDWARAFGLPLVIEPEGEGPYTNVRSLHKAAALAGKQAFGVELSQAGQVTSFSVERGLRGCLNLLRALGVLQDRTPEPPPGDQVIARGAVFVRAHKGGMWIPEVPLGTFVHKGARLGMLSGLDFSWEEPILSSADGLFYRAAMHRPVNASERVASIALA